MLFFLVFTKGITGNEKKMGLLMEAELRFSVKNFPPGLSMLPFPETNSKFVPKNGWLEDNPVSYWVSAYFFRGELLVSGRVDSNIFQEIPKLIQYLEYRPHFPPSSFVVFQESLGATCQCQRGSGGLAFGSQVSQ